MTWFFALAACTLVPGDSGPSSGGLGEALACDPVASTAAPAGTDCREATITCGAVVEATNAGGGEGIDEGTWNGLACFPTRETFRAPERAWDVIVEEGQEVDLTLESPCGELALGAFPWEEDTCPVGVDLRLPYGDCEGLAPGAGGTVTLAEAGRWLVVVDGVTGQEHNFRLTVACR